MFVFFYEAVFLSLDFLYLRVIPLLLSAASVDWLEWSISYNFDGKSWLVIENSTMFSLVLFFQNLFFLSGGRMAFIQW